MQKLYSDTTLTTVRDREAYIYDLFHNVRREPVRGRNDIIQATTVRHLEVQESPFSDHHVH
jgi:hypothetical protein